MMANRNTKIFLASLPEVLDSDAALQALPLPSVLTTHLTCQVTMKARALCHSILEGVVVATEHENSAGGLCSGETFAACIPFTTAYQLERSSLVPEHGIALLDVVIIV